MESKSGEGNNEEEEEEEKQVVKMANLGTPKLTPFRFDHTGPFEPLLLSSHGKIPIIQVPSSINCRQLEHQRVGVKFLYGLYKNNHGGILGDDKSHYFGKCFT